jgi:uncharacterized protein (UPF0303 family)
MTPAPTINELLAQEESLVLERFDYALAWELGARLRATAAERALPVAIEIAHGATPVFLALLPGATPDNNDWVRRKRNVALRFHHSSLYMRLLCENRAVNFHARYRLPEADFAASGGGVPLFVRNVGVVGAVAVSGLPDVEDHRLVMAALEELGIGVR